MNVDCAVVIDTKDPAAIYDQVQQIYNRLFGEDNLNFVAQAFGWFVDCFAGRYRDYQAVDMAYHDREHTLQGTMCFATLMQGRHQAGAEPVITRRMFELGLLGILLHDSGYLKKNEDTKGTGAKYTMVHVDRSCAFARELLLDKGFSQHDVEQVQHMISCTGIDVNLGTICFQTKIERTIGLAIATADLLGQMSAADYVDRLSDLYLEFNESWEYSGNSARTIHFDSLDHLIGETPGFWDRYVRQKIEIDCMGLYRFLNQPYPDGPNKYLMRIEANIDKVRQIIAQKN